MTKAIVVRIEGDYVITAQGADLLSAIASQASDARDEAVSAAAAALAAAGVGEYANTGAGLSGTTEGETFWVDLGDGTGQVYRHDPGPTATPLHKFIIDPTDSGAADIFAGGVPTTAALASSAGAGMVGFEQTGSGAVVRTLADRLRDTVSVKDFGALGDDATDDYLAIVAARTVALATGRALMFPDGIYRHSNTLEFGFSNLRVLFGDVTLRHTGAGKAVSFDSGPTPNEDGENNIYFGWDCPPTLIGNADTTDLAYVRGIHHSKFNLRMRDCETGLRVEFAVLSDFRLNGSINEGPFPDQQPTNWLVVDRRGSPEATTACNFHCILEGASDFGMDLKAAQYCHFWGTSEANDGGGVWVRSDSLNNTFHGFFCEQNGDAEHWLIDGHSNSFINCSGGGASNTGQNDTLVNGVRNYFVRGLFHDVTEVGYLNEWDQVALSGTYAPNGVASIRRNCHDGALGVIPDASPVPNIIAPTLSGLWVNADTAGIRDVGWWKDSYGWVHLVGGVKNGSAVMWTLPVGCRPGGTIWRTVWNPNAGAHIVVAVGTNGEVQHVSGDVGAIPLDGISFLAEG